MRRPVFVGTAGAVAALLLGAAGCAGDPEPRFAPPSGEESPSASESASASVSESAAPERLSREETVRAWVEARNAALQDGETSGMLALQLNCPGCVPFYEPIEATYTAGGYYLTDGWTVLKMLVVDRQTVDLRVEMAAGSSLASASSSSGVAPLGRVPAIGLIVIVPSRTLTRISGLDPTTAKPPKLR